MSAFANGGRRGTVVVAAVTTALLALGMARHGALLSVATTADRHVRIGAFFDDESPMVGALIRVSDRAGETVVEGKADAGGYFDWTDPVAGYFVVVADDGAGHRGRQTFTLSSFQLDGAVRDLIAETGRPLTLAERIRALPRWLTALAGVIAIVAVFSLIAWRRTARELAALKAERG